MQFYSFDSKKGSNVPIPVALLDNPNRSIVLKLPKDHPLDENLRDLIVKNVLADKNLEDGPRMILKSEKVRFKSLFYVRTCY